MQKKMNNQTSTYKSNKWCYGPIIGFSLFLLLYTVAACLYPGGTKENPSQKGFSIIHNYWCDLLDKTTYGGGTNSGYTVAMIAMIVLCISMLFFWNILPTLFDKQRYSVSITRWTGSLSSSLSLLIFTPLHDNIIHLLVLFGIVAFISTVFGLYKAKQYRIFLGALIVLFSGITNYIIWYSGYGLTTLALLQKITFLLFISWAMYSTIATNKLLSTMSIKQDSCQ